MTRRLRNVNGHSSTMLGVKKSFFVVWGGRLPTSAKFSTIGPKGCEATRGPQDYVRGRAAPFGQKHVGLQVEHFLFFWDRWHEISKNWTQRLVGSKGPKHKPLSLTCLLSLFFEGLPSAPVTAQITLAYPIVKGVPPVKEV